MINDMTWVKPYCSANFADKLWPIVDDDIACISGINGEWVGE